jgi:hypothetical protein
MKILKSVGALAMAEGVIATGTRAAIPPFVIVFTSQPEAHEVCWLVSQTNSALSTSVPAVSGVAAARSSMFRSTVEVASFVEQATRVIVTATGNMN